MTDHEDALIVHDDSASRDAVSVGHVRPNVEVTGEARQDALPVRRRIDKRRRAGKAACRGASG